MWGANRYAHLSRQTAYRPPSPPSVIPAPPRPPRSKEPAVQTQSERFLEWLKADLKDYSPNYGYAFGGSHFVKMTEDGYRGARPLRMGGAAMTVSLFGLSPFWLAAYMLYEYNADLQRYAQSLLPELPTLPDLSSIVANAAAAIAGAMGSVGAGLQNTIQQYLYYLLAALGVYVGYKVLTA